ncbi:antibiotic biosynthesis monooxygenase [Aliinostoc sp. HNIBRCY26]|uniref:antibiotic biosynthesis monooxygenase n=1 Tax=Aliinostoc sp. HNIBRCY26 TaxID=3418997 RepID=UPI003D08B8E0
MVAEMISILAKVSVENLEKFVGVFSTRGAEIRKQHGSLSAEIFKSVEEENTVWVLFQWMSKENFEGFLNDPVVKETMKSSGTIGQPEFIFLNQIGLFSA